jgi:hypothetical protein
MGRRGQFENRFKEILGQESGWAVATQLSTDNALGTE